MSERIEDLRPRRRGTLLPDPTPRPARHRIISVDDHLIEPADLFEGRMPAGMIGDAPRIIEMADGRQMWRYEEKLYPNIGLNAVVGRPVHEWAMEPARFDEMRPGCYDIEARIADMDIGGVWASLCFPSLVAGFAGAVFSASREPALGLACTRAWNDWHHEEWASPYPERIIPLQITWLADPAIAAAEVYRNAERGFKAVSFPELPTHLGLPSMHTAHWDPFLHACEETETVICLHAGSARWSASPSPEAPLEMLSTLFPVNAIAATADWLWARIPLRFPRLNVALSEGGFGWVPMLIDRIDYVMAHSGLAGHAWPRGELSPTDALRRNFWFCSIDDPSVLELRHHIGIDHIMIEVDYPHSDSSWPDTQALIERRFAGLADDEVRKICWANAARLFRHYPKGESDA